MNILICPSHNYIMPYGIMLESLYANNKSEDIHVYAIIDEDVTEDDKMALEDVVKKHHAKQIFYKFFTEEVFNTFPNLESTHINKTAYYRLFAATLLPKDVTKILYLDGDIIIMDSLKGLWDTNVDGIAVAGVMNQTQSYGYYNRLHYPSKLGYINSGVLLINLKYWRDYQIENRFVDFIQKYPDRIRWHDQDVINYVLQEYKRFLPLIYNVQSGFYQKPEYCEIDYWSMESEILNAQKHPIVLHFTGNEKPWFANSRHPRVKDFLTYKENTLWDDVPLLKVRKTWKKKLRSHIRRLMEFMQILPHRVHINKYIDNV